MQYARYLAYNNARTMGAIDAGVAEYHVISKNRYDVVGSA